jgi:DNA polymerase I
MKTLIIDCSFLMYKSYFAYPSLTFEEKPVGAFFGFVKTVLQLISHLKPDQLVFANDTPEPTWRHKLHDDYKAGRAKIEDNLVFQIPLIQSWCQKVSSNYFTFPGWEADDVIFSIVLSELSNFSSVRRQKNVVQYSGSSNNLFEEGVEKPEFPYKFSELLKASNTHSNAVYVFSSDRDLYQMLSLPALRFINSSKVGLEEFGIEDFKTKYELEPLQWLDYKAIAGDASDNLKGVEGVGPKTATKFLQQVGCLFSFYEKLGLDHSPFLRTAGACWTAKVDLDEYFANPKNQIFIDKMKENYKVVVDTYLMSSLQVVPEINFSTSGFDLKPGVGDLQSFGFKSLVTMTNKLAPEEQEGLF